MAISKALLKALPELGPDRFWRISIDKKSNNAPIKVALHEWVIVGTKVSPNLSTELAFVRTIARRERIVAAAEKVLLVIGQYREFIGDYGVNPAKEAKDAE